MKKKRGHWRASYGVTLVKILEKIVGFVSSPNYILYMYEQKVH